MAVLTQFLEKLAKTVHNPGRQVIVFAKAEDPLFQVFELDAQLLSMGFHVALLSNREPYHTAVKGAT